MRNLIVVVLCLATTPIFGQPGSAAEMVYIPKGEFNMGKNSASPTDWQPEHRVSLDAFYMDRCEVTNQQYFDFCKATNHPLPMFWGMKEFQCGLDFPDHPVVGVSLFEAEQYAKFVNKRLPTEAEWEYAARGSLADMNFPNGMQMDSSLANYGQKYKSILKVGSFPPNGFGLCDMAGNVWEWTSDNYQGDYYKSSPAIQPRGPERGRFKVIRGGSWHSGAMCLQTYYRNGLPPSWVDFAVGFRCVRNAPK